MTLSKWEEGSSSTETYEIFVSSENWSSDKLSEVFYFLAIWIKDYRWEEGRPNWCSFKKDPKIMYAIRESSALRAKIIFANISLVILFLNNSTKLSSLSGTSSSFGY